LPDSPATRVSLLLRLRNPQDDAAWGEFVELYTPLVYGQLRKHGLQDADVADLSQEVFATVARAVGQFDYDPQRGTFRSWFFTIVRRKLSDWWSTRAHRPRGSGDTDTHRLLEQWPAPKPAEDEWEADWERRVFAWACERVRRDVTLPTWQAFWRTAFEGQSCKQVATDLGLSVAAVYLARSRVLARLQELVQSAQES
jgi:RNA polymerase sigma factor (sigma-70 family)